MSENHFNLITIAVIGRTPTTENCNALQQLCTIISERDIRVIVEDSFYNDVKKNKQVSCGFETFTSIDSIRNELDYILSIGGDGTLLNTVDFVGNSHIPVVGINTGRLGFLAHYTVDQMPELIQNLVEKNYQSDFRSLLEVESNQSIFEGKNFALNEFSIQKKDPSAVLKLDAFINGEFLSTYWSDGIIISTPTGSTGYNLSVNGPIMSPLSEVIAITPIAPHNLNLRPIIASDQSEVTLKIGDSRGPCYCTIDSKYWEIDQSFEFSLKKANFAINIIRPPHTSYIDTLRTKLMWGLDNRNR